MNNTINHNHILSLMQTGFITIGVRFLGGDKEYTYKALESEGVQVGDEVIIDSPREGMKIVMVTRVDSKPQIDLSSPFPYKWIVQKVCRARYDDLLRQEQEFKDALVEVERVRQREVLMKSFHEYLPEGSEARKLFDVTMTKVVAHVPNT